jgi:hypothetical protein
MNPGDAGDGAYNNPALLLRRLFNDTLSNIHTEYACFNLIFYSYRNAY